MNDNPTPPGTVLIDDYIKELKALIAEDQNIKSNLRRRITELETENATELARYKEWLKKRTEELQGPPE